MIARGYQALVEKLTKACITVVSLQPRDVSEMYDYWKTLGALTGKERQAMEMTETFEAALSAVRSQVVLIPERERKKVYFEAIHSKMKTFAPTSIAVFVLKAAGGLNVADDAISVRGTNIAAYGKERILSHADDIDVYLAQKGTMNSVTVRQIKEEGGFMAIKAVRNDQVYIIDEQIVSRPTLRLLEGIHGIRRILYPDRCQLSIDQ
jgi:iron complex transport system substrate-binding protein